MWADENKTTKLESEGEEYLEGTHDMCGIVKVFVLLNIMECL